MAFSKGQSGNPLGKPKGTPNKITLDQRAIFEEAISPEDRVAIVKKVFAHAMRSDPKDSAPFAKLIFQYIFSLPKVGHEVTVLDMTEVFTTEVKDAVFREVLKEAILRDASQAKNQPRLSIIDAAVVEQAKDNGRQKGNGQARNGRKKKEADKKTRKG